MTFLLLDNHSDHITTLSLHELLFCVEQDLTLLLLSNHNDRKNALSLHELLFYVDQDLTLLLLDNHNYYKNYCNFFPGNNVNDGLIFFR